MCYVLGKLKSYVKCNKILAIEKGHVRFAPPPRPFLFAKILLLYDLIITSPLYAINQLRKHQRKNTASIGKEHNKVHLDDFKNILEFSAFTFISV